MFRLRIGKLSGALGVFLLQTAVERLEEGRLSSRDAIRFIAALTLHSNSSATFSPLRNSVTACTDVSKL